MTQEILKTGTTTVAIKCKNGIVLAADKRATAGNIIANSNIVKTYPITDKIGMTVAGSVSDVQLITKYIKAQLKLKKLQSRREVSVKEAVNLLSGIVYSNIRSLSTMPGITHFLIGGRDDEGFHIYDLYPDGSIAEEETFISSGSGSPMVYGVLEINYKKEITVKEAKELVTTAIRAAVKRDSASGDGIDILTINESEMKTETATI